MGAVTLVPKCKHLHGLRYIGALEMFKMVKDSNLCILFELPLSLAFSPKKQTMSNHLFSICYWETTESLGRKWLF